MNPSQEAQLIEQCRTDPAAFGQVFDEWYAPVFGYIFRRTADYDLSKDIAAETFLKAFLKIHNFQWRGISLLSWLYRIATNELNQYYRSCKYEPQSLQQLLENPQMEKLLHQQESDEREVLEKELKAYNDYNLPLTNNFLLRFHILKKIPIIALRFLRAKNRF